MAVAPVSLEESRRLAALQSLQLLDTAPEPAFDEVTRLAAALLDVPIATVSLVDETRQWFKSRHGLDAAQTPRDVSLCTHAIEQDTPLVVNDATADARFASSPLVTGELHLRAYVGVPLRTNDGHAIGTLCVIDRQPRHFSAEQLQRLQDLASIAQREVRQRERTRRVQALAERSLAAADDSERLYHATFDGAGVGIAVVGLDGRWLRVNPKLCRILGREAAQLMSCTFQDITHPEDLHADLDRVEQLLAGQASDYTLEKRYLRPDGSQVWGQLTVTLVRDAGGQPLHFVSLVEDITRRREAEEALQRLRQQLEQRVAERTAELQRLNREQHLMLDNELFGIVRLRDRHTVWTNRAFEQLFGYGPGEALGLPSRLLYPDDASHARVGREGYAAIRAGRTYRVQLELQRKSGERLWVDMSGTMLSPDTGESLWMLQDISAMKRYERKVEEMAYHDALTGLPNRMLLLDRLQLALQATARAGQCVAVCFADLNGFKGVNDLHGHEAGDAVLQAVAQRLKASVRSHDTVARLGGDEFVLVLTQLASPEEAEAVVQRAEAAVRAPMHLDDGTVVSVSASFGIVTARDASAEPADLIAQADVQMYAAKRRRPSGAGSARMAAAWQPA